MSIFGATTSWERGDQPFLDKRYSRKHAWRFDGGLEVPASASPHIVRPPLSDPAAVDPEEAFVASISSCHMLWFLSIAADRQFRVDRYVDEAVGAMGKNAAGKVVVASVTLRPKVAFSGDKLPTATDIAQMHHAAHAECFIANSVTADVQVEPTLDGQR